MSATSDVACHAAYPTMVTSQVLRQTVPEVSQAFSLMEFYRSALQKVYFMSIATASCEMKTTCFSEYLTFYSSVSIFVLAFNIIQTNVGLLLI